MIRSRSTAVIVAAAMLVVTAVAALVGHARLPFFTLITPITIVVTILVHFATALVLTATLRADWRRSRLVLAAGYLGGALILTLLLFTQSYEAGNPALIRADPGFANCLFTLWNVSGALLGFAYAILRGRDDRPRRFRRRTSMTLAFGGSVVGVGLVIVVARLLGGYPQSDAAMIAIGLVISPALILAAAAVWRADEQRIGSAFSLGLFAMGLAFVLETFDSTNGTIGKDLAALMYTAGLGSVLAVAIDDLVGAFNRLGETEEALTEHTQRLAAIWEIASDSALDDRARFQAMLDAGGRAIRAGMPFFGHVARVVGDECVIEAVISPQTLPPDHADLSRKLPVGFRIPLRDAVHAEIFASRGTRDWSDVLLDPSSVRRRILRSLGLRAVIGTTFAVGPTQYLLVYGSRQPCLRPFTRDDRTFLAVLASFFAARLHQQRQLDHMRHQAETDSLTGLLNRSAFRSAASRILRESGRAQTPSALVTIDLDRFREINDSYGHVVGDNVLIGVAEALRGRLAMDDLVGRLGGDLFAVLMCNIESRADVEERMAALNAAFAGPFSTTASDESVRLRATMGVAIFPADARAYEGLLARSEAALQFAKRSDRASAFYSRDLESVLEVRRTMRRTLANGIGAGELVVHYQPSIALDDGRASGAEALVRWRHPTRGLVGPDDFIPFAEEHGLVGQVGDWVLRQVAVDIGLLGDAIRGTRIYVNLSLHQVDDPAFIDNLRRMMAERPNLVDRLGFEITESAAIRDAGQTLRTLAVIRGFGIPVALDDFGTGYSSLAHLKRLPVDAIKIDRSFVAGLPSDEHDAALIETQLTIARRFGYETFAEGVEREDQLMLLRALGCRHAQGFLIARPMPLDEYVRWLADSEREAARAQRFTA